MMYFDDHGMGAAGWWASGLVMLLFWSAVLAVLVLVVRRLWSEPRARVPADPLRLLDERFARGELDEREYLRRRELLTARTDTVGTQSR